VGNPRNQSSPEEPHGHRPVVAERAASNAPATGNRQPTSARNSARAPGEQSVVTVGRRRGEGRSTARRSVEVGSRTGLQVGGKHRTAVDGGNALLAALSTTTVPGQADIGKLPSWLAVWPWGPRRAAGDMCPGMPARACCGVSVTSGRTKSTPIRLHLAIERVELRDRELEGRTRKPREGQDDGPCPSGAPNRRSRREQIAGHLADRLARALA